ncbi:MAG: hypothetical protein ACE5FF_15590 [Saprospiraceae bacterium]
MIITPSGTKRVRTHFPVGALVLLCLGMAACVKKPPVKTKEEVIQERVAKRLSTWKNDWEKKCRKNIMERATAIVDSTILANARLNRDTTGLPPLPERPQKPEFTAPDDSLPVQPLLLPPADTSVSGLRQ